jgi:hypothetical protein
MTHVCTFPDRTQVAVSVIDTEGTRTRVQWTSEQGLVSSVWVPSDWIKIST